MAKQNYETLNAIRGVAALCVVAYHTQYLSNVRISSHGYLAVDLFFVLSGFVIAHAYDGRMATGFGLARFAKTRLIRFYPQYLLGLAIGVACELGLIAMRDPEAMSGPSLAWTALCNAFFIPWATASVRYNLFPLNVPAWSLLFEILVNIAYAALYTKLSQRFLIVTVISAGAAVLVSAIAKGTANLGSDVPDVFGPDLLGGVARTVFSFTLGLALYRYRISLIRVPAPLLLVVAAVALAVPAKFSPGYDLAFIFIISPALVVLGSNVEPSESVKSFFRNLGIISFPLYAIHSPIIGLAKGIERAFHISGLLLALLSVVACIVASLALDRLYDRPARSWLTARFNRRVAADPAAAAAP